MKRTVITISLQLAVCLSAFAQTDPIDRNRWYEEDPNYDHNNWRERYSVIEVDGMSYFFNNDSTAVQPTRANRERPRRVIPEYIEYEGKTYPVYLLHPMFSEDQVVEEVELYCRMKGMYDTFKYCSNLKSVILPDCLEYLGNFTFVCSNLTKLVLPKSLKKIGTDAIHCKNLETLVVNDSLEWVEFGAFNLPKIKEFRFPASVKYVRSPFFSCKELRSVIFEDGDGDLNTIFYGSKHPAIKYLYCGRRSMNPDWNLPNLEELVIGPLVRVLELPGFDVTNIRELKVYAKSEAPEPIYLDLGKNASDIYQNATLYVPKGTRELYMATDGWNRFLNIVEYGATGISSVRSASDSKAIYNINGHRLASPQKGIYIQNGKKYIAK